MQVAMPDLNFDLDPGLGETMRIPGSKSDQDHTRQGEASTASAASNMAVMKQHEMMLLMEHQRRFLEAGGNQHQVP